MVVRQLGPDEADLALCALRSVNGRKSAEDMSVEAFLNDPAVLQLVAMMGGIVVGSLNGHFLRRPEATSQFLLYEVDVLESHRRKGVGRRLVETAKAMAKDRGCGSMWVLTDSEENVAAHALYRSCGAQTKTESDRMYVFDLG
jgi:GNAT superfamily N-acetyltransferase